LLPAPTVIRGFQLGPTPWSPGHRGVDLAARPGAAVRAPANGTVFFAGVLAGRPVLSIDHGDGLISSFEPVVSRVAMGGVVIRGQVVGNLSPGPTHCRPAVCLHWGVRKNGRYLDPLTLLPARRGPAVLLPMLR
jgi:murein DD-endopeptidase MepM/ murein hydrolase activator NlpD